MKSIINSLFIMILFTLLINCNSDIEVVEFYDSGSVKIEKAYYYHNKYDLINYFENGQLKSKETFINEMIIGERTTYFKNGNVKSKYNYENGKLSGTQTSFYINEKPKSIENYESGLQNGNQEYYNKQGQLIKTCKYKNDRIIEEEIFSNKGLITEYKKFEEWNSCIKHYKKYLDSLDLYIEKRYENCYLISEGFYSQNGLKQGSWVYLNNDSITKKGKYIDDLKDGRWDYYPGYYT